MNVFGIDYGRTSSVIVLREGGTAIRSVGDGLRTVIPHSAVASPGSAAPYWGSHAALANVPGLATCAPTPRAVPVTPSQRQNDGFLTQTPLSSETRALTFAHLLPGPWTTEPEASLFWSGLQDRLFRYLGRMAATEANGYRVVVAISPGNQPDAPAVISRLAHGVGLQDIEIIRATDALVCRFIASPEGVRASGQTTPLSVVAIALGDVATDISGYHLVLQSITNDLLGLRAERIESGFASLPFGSSHWLLRLVDDVHQHLREPLPPGQELLLQDAAREFGAALGRATTDDTLVSWNGPFRDRMYSPLRLHVQDCLRDWPEANGLVRDLPERIREAARKAGSGDDVPDILLLGGAGARWPFVLEAVRQIAEQDTAKKLLIWQSATSDEDVARGASWWPEIGSGTLPALRGDAPQPALGAEAVAETPKAARRKTAPPVRVPEPSTVFEVQDIPDSSVPPSLRQLDF